MDEYIAAYKAYLASTRSKILVHFYRHMSKHRCFEVNSSIAISFLLIIATSTLAHTHITGLVALILFTLLSFYITYYLICMNFRRVYLPLYHEYGDKMENNADTFVRYLAFINQIRIRNLYMVDDLEKIIRMINAELTDKHISFIMLNTLPRLLVTILLTILIGSLLYTWQGQLPLHPLLMLGIVMAVLIIGSGYLASYRKSMQLHTLKKFCEWAIVDIEDETDFDGVEEVFKEKTRNNA